MRLRRGTLFALVALTLAACTDSARDPVGPQLDASASASAGLNVDTIPARDTDLGGYWERMSDEALWQHIERQGGSAVLGVKNPGQPRGVWRATILTLPANLNGARSAVTAMRGVTVIPAEDRLPVLRLRIESLEALTALRARPWVDYLQPMYMEPASEDGAAAMDGCGWGDAYTGGAPLGALGDVIPLGLSRMGIRDAWRRNAGQLAVIGITDTGVSFDQANLRWNFASGESTGRWHDILTVIDGGTNDQCGHGTRIAGLAVAPQNGSSIMGAAWRASAVSVRHGNGVSTSSGINSANAASAIIMAVETRYYWPHNVNQRRIVTMAWGARSSHSNVEDAVRYTQGLGALHLGASGSGVGWLTGAVFPSTMYEVISVSAVNPNYSQASGIGYGNAVELSAFIDMHATGQFTSQTRTMGGSSAAVTAVAGIAALVWTQYPNETHGQIRQRLQRAGHIFPNRNTTVGFGVVNAYQAVGGFRGLSVSCPSHVPAYSTFTCTMSPLGDGPFTFQWWGSGSTTSSATFQAGADGHNVWVSGSATDTVENFTRSAWREVLVGHQPLPPPSSPCDPTFELCPVEPY
jgi:serine protease